MAHQLHYASLPKETTGRAGFQFTARSAGTPPDAERLIERFMTYRPPAGAAGAADQCPVSLAYDQTRYGPVMVCCRYLGEDYTGRPGNFLGHAVIASRAELDGLRPIELWRAPFWAGAPAADLAELDAVTAGDTIDPERVTGMLATAGEPGYGVLAALLDAVRDTFAAQAGPVILVSDDVDRVALWIAAVSYSLPIAVARYLSFVTYTAEPRLARHHLVGTTPQAWSAGRADGVAFHLDSLDPPDGPQPSPYATLVVAAWRVGDLAKIDTLCAVAASAIRTIPGSTGQGSGLDAAAGLLALCRGQPVADQYQGAALRVLEALPEHDRMRLLDRTAAALASADGHTVHALLDGDGGHRLADLLVDRDWSAAPQVARLVYAQHGRRHSDRRTEMAARLVDLAASAGTEDLAQAVAELWTDTDPSPAECGWLLEHLDQGVTSLPEVRELINRTLTAADLTDPAAVALARAVASRYPGGIRRPWPYDAPFSPEPTEPDQATASDPDPLAAGARVLLGATGIAEGHAEGRAARRLAESADRLAWWYWYADPVLARRALRHCAEVLAALPVTGQVEVLGNAAPGTREMIVDNWLAHLADEPETRADLAEVAVRLRGCQVAIRPLDDYLLALSRRPLGYRRVHRVLELRGGGLADALRQLVAEVGGGWRMVFRRPAGDPP
ncbi:MAG TPA: hypothetical protein VHJ83_09920 [Micromonosporaceae bacterium]|jgi:hypothetical protein|nr:hypothetical protein [Micromonosporaceae bacterium]